MLAKVTSWAVIGCLYRWCREVRVVRPALVLIALLTVGGAFGCSQSSSHPEPNQTPPIVSVSPTSTPPSGQESTFCIVDLPDSWRSLLAQGRISLPGGDFAAFATAADGSEVFGGLKLEDWSGVVSVTPQGSTTRIRAFDNPATDGVIGGAFDGRWLVWSEGHSSTDWNDWDIRAWDSTSGQVIDIAAAPRVGGATVQGPFVMPVVSQGKAAWVQANQSGQGEAHLYSLAERQDRVLSEGNAGPPVVFWGSSLIWQELDIPGQLGHLAMADVTTGEQLPPPEPLASVRHLGSLAASNELVAWTGDLHSLSIWRPGEPEARQIFTADMGDGVDWIAIAGDLVTWGGAETQWAADLRSRSVTRLTQQYGWRYTNGNALLVTQPIAEMAQTKGYVSEVEVVDATRLPPLPACGS
jgi:hypothetical protein